MQFNRDAEGRLHPLPKPSIDTGMGLERMAAVLQGVTSNYDSDLFMPLISATGERTGHVYGNDAASDRSLRVIADHLRAITFMIVTGSFPQMRVGDTSLRRISPTRFTARSALRGDRTLSP